MSNTARRNSRLARTWGNVFTAVTGLVLSGGLAVGILAAHDAGLLAA